MDANGNHFSYTSGPYAAGRLVAVQYAAFTPTGYSGGNGGNGLTVPSSVTFTDMFAYTQPGLTSGKELQLQETFNWYKNNNPETTTQTLTFNAAYAYINEGKMTSVTYPSTVSYNASGQQTTTTGPTYNYSFDAMYRPTGMTDQNNNTDVSNVTYNAANQLLSLNYFGIAETRIRRPRRRDILRRPYLTLTRISSTRTRGSRPLQTSTTSVPAVRKHSEASGISPLYPARSTP